MAISAEALNVQIDTRNADDIVADAIDLLATRQPEWIPRNGAPEVIYLEAVAQAVTEVAVAAQAEVGAVVETLLSELYQVPRLPGAGATGEVTLTFDTSVTTTIPTGTRFLLPDTGVELVTTADVPVSASLTAVLPVATATATAAVNGTGSAASLDLLDTVPNALSAQITLDLSGGTEPESDSAYLTRAVQRLARVTSSLVVTDHFSAYVLEDGQTSNAVAIAAWDGASIGTAGTDGGHVTVAAYGRGGQLPAGVKTALAAAMQAITAAGATVHVVDAALSTVDVTATVHPIAGYDTNAVRDACEAALAAWLAPETWEFGETVRVTTLTTVLAAVEGVDYVTSVTTPAADVTLNANGLPAAGALSITVA